MTRATRDSFDTKLSGATKLQLNTATERGRVSTMEKEKLTPKQERFVQEYLVDMNATQAAIRVGYSPKTANQQSSRLMANVKISAAIADRAQKSFQKAHLTVERIDQELARLAFADIRKLYDEAGNLKPPSEWDDETAAAVAGLEVNEVWEGSGAARTQTGLLKKIKTWDKGAALALAARRLGLLKDKVDVEVKISLEDLIMQSIKPVAPATPVIEHEK